MDNNAGIVHREANSVQRWACAGIPRCSLRIFTLILHVYPFHRSEWTLLLALRVTPAVAQARVDP